MAKVECIWKFSWQLLLATDVLYNTWGLTVSYRYSDRYGMNVIPSTVLPLLSMERAGLLCFQSPSFEVHKKINLEVKASVQATWIVIHSISILLHVLSNHVQFESLPLYTSCSFDILDDTSTTILYKGSYARWEILHPQLALAHALGNSIAHRWPLQVSENNYRLISCVDDLIMRLSKSH